MTSSPSAASTTALSGASDLSSPGRPREREYMVEMIEALDRRPETTVVWCHAGLTVGSMRTGTRTDQGLRRTLRQALLDLVVGAVRARDLPGRPAASGLDSAAGSCPERFVLGSDTVGNLDGFETQIRAFEPLLERLDPSVREPVSHVNASGCGSPDESSIGTRAGAAPCWPKLRACCPPGTPPAGAPVLSAVGRQRAWRRYARPPRRRGGVATGR